MTGIANSRIAAKWFGPICVGLLGGGLVIAAWAGHEDRVRLLPKLQNGDSVQYETRARIDRHVATKSNVQSMVGPRQVRRDLASALRLDIQEYRVTDSRPMLSGDTRIVALDAPDADQAAAKPAKVLFTVGGEGDIHVTEGADDLDPEESLTWQFWAAQFAFGWTLPVEGVKPGEKWKSGEPEKTPAPIANLVWERETTYVQNDKCPLLPTEDCAVFLTSATLRQKSNPKDTTPEDYRLHQLKTSGTATGTNETIAYISLKTGLLMRATEDLQQTMDVTIAQADGSNQIHYTIAATSHLETSMRAPAGANAD
ncbi:MAG TPA: hypothetical protein VMT75_05655 [Candidatus Saccharimonadales bacterium]|nr:hypothetical protein [Candidatus Saccharimonadales bacterium]